MTRFSVEKWGKVWESEVLFAFPTLRFAKDGAPGLCAGAKQGDFSPGAGGARMTPDPAAEITVPYGTWMFGFSVMARY